MEDLKRTPLYDEHIALGARMVDYAGWAMPVQYQGIIEEHLATREAVGIFDVSHMGEFRISGEGSYEFLQKMLCNDLEKINECGAAQYTLLLNDEGGIIDDLIVYNTGCEYLIIANAANVDKDFAWLASHQPADVVLENESNRTGLIAVQGPQSAAIVQELAGPDWEAPKRFQFGAATLDGTINCLIARTGYTGEDGFEIVLHEEDTAAAWRLLLSFPQVSPVGLGARDTLRLEMGYHLYGNDMDESRNPIEAGLGWVCPKAKEGYRGSETVARAREEGVAQKLVYLLLEKGIPRPGYPVLHDGVQVGVVASGTHSPSLKQGVATAYIPSELAVVGTELSVQVRKNEFKATVVKAPFYQG